MSVYNIQDKFFIEFDTDKRYNDVDIYNMILDDQTMEELSEEFRTSFECSNNLEKDNPHTDVQELEKYLISNKTPDIKELYIKIFNSDAKFKRNTFIGVKKGKKINCKSEEFWNIGMKHDELDYTDLQDLVKYYYNADTNEENIIINANINIRVLGFILYLIYERIHPHADGNGRIGRLLFIENDNSNYRYFPLSTIIHTLRIQNLIEDCYKEVQFPGSIDLESPETYNYKSKNEYYHIKINEKVLKNIRTILMLIQEYKILHRRFQNHNRCNMYISMLLRKRTLTDASIIKIINNDDTLFVIFNSTGFDIHLHNTIWC